MLIVVCGVSGVGKTTIGRRLAGALELPFFDADDFHPAANVEKMARGMPLKDADRQPWLEALAQHLSDQEKKVGAVVAFSGLKEPYREMIKAQYNGIITWIFLHGPERLIADRLDSRKGHFSDQRLLNSQFAALDIPDYGWLFDVDASPDDIVNNILERLHRECT